MTYYAGLDVSMKETFFCIVDEIGKRVCEGQTLTDPHLIAEALTGSRFALKKIGLESGSLSHYLTNALVKLGLPAICIDARKMAAILSVTVNKTDKNDVRGIADAIRCHHYKEVHVRDEEEGALGILLKSRSILVRQRTTLKNTVRGHLKFYGIRLGAVSAKQFSKKVREHYNALNKGAVLGLEGLLVTFDNMTQEIGKIEAALQQMCRQDADVRLLMTIPGVGLIVASSFKADVGDPQRFQKSSAVGAYYGMTPRQYSSGKTVRMGRISHCGSEEVRTHLAEAATVLLTRSQVWSSLKVWGLKIMKKHGFKKAIVAVARKLAVIMHRMLGDQTEFRMQ